MARRTERMRAGQSGFTIIEILLVVVIMGALLAVIIPRAQRARVDANYTVVRQSAAELAKWGMEWATRNLEAQREDEDCTLIDYIETLTEYTGDITKNWRGDANRDVADDLTSGCRTVGLNTVVSDIMQADLWPKNPFSTMDYFNTNSDGRNYGDLSLKRFPVATLVPGISYYYAFVFPGIDSTMSSGKYTTFHGAMGNGSTDAELRAGVFMARLVP